MYIPKHFDVSDELEQYAFIEQNAFGQLISQVDGRLFSTHIPFLLSEDKTKLYGHLAAQNPQHSALDDQEVLVTLEGAHDYISPAWFEAAGVPTWNYQALHLYGTCRIFRDTDQLKAVVDALTEKFESGYENPWEPTYHAAMLGAIVGVEISIGEIQCKYKLNQNRSARDRALVIEQLEAHGSVKLAQAMAKNEIR